MSTSGHLSKHSEAGKQHCRQYCDICHGQASLLSGQLTAEMTRREQRRNRRLHHFAIISVLLVFLLHWRFQSTVPSSSTSEHKVNDPAFFNWTAHPPSKVLNWTECYDSFQCARLTVPLVYSDPSGEEGAVALIKSPSNYPPGLEKHRGSVLFNPGGPGGSGVSVLLRLSPSFRTILGDGFDFIGFDPRGVGFTTPTAEAFENPLEAIKYHYQFPQTLNSSTSSLGETYARARILGSLAEERNKFVAERVSTPTVARDMLSIIQATGEEKLQYWGFSYGTILGATFSAMFPDNVGRVIIDGVADWEDYYNGKWENNLRDTDTALMNIYQSCAKAGPLKCSLYENSTSLVQARVENILDGLKTAPMPLYSSATALFEEDYEVIDYGMVKTAIFRTLYSPHSTGAKLVNALAALEKGDPSGIYALSDKRVYNSLLQCHCPALNGSIPIFDTYTPTYAIACGDIVVSNPESLDDLRKVYRSMAETSHFADTWPIRVLCSGWEIRAKERFEGPFNLQYATSHPLLLIGNVADPVTPVWNAHKMSKNFKDSVVLTQNSPGHCSAAATSLCTTKVIREYFINGTLPQKGTVCDVQSSIFDGDPQLESLSMEDRQLIEASQMLQNNYFIPMLGGGRI